MVKLQLCTEQLSQLSDILPHLEVDRHTHTQREGEEEGKGGGRKERWMETFMILILNTTAPY